MKIKNASPQPQIPILLHFKGSNNVKKNVFQEQIKIKVLIVLKSANLALF